MDFSTDFWFFWMYLINVFYKVITNLKFYKRCFIKDYFHKDFFTKYKKTSENIL